MGGLLALSKSNSKRSKSYKPAGGWRRTVPSEPGWYWFSGYASPAGAAEGYSMTVVVLIQEYADSGVKFAHGPGDLFMRLDEVAGWWRPLQVPKPPRPPED